METGLEKLLKWIHTPSKWEAENISVTTKIHELIKEEKEQSEPKQSSLPTDEEIEQWVKEQPFKNCEAGDSAIERKKLQDMLMAFIEFPHPHNESRGSIINRFLDEYLTQNNK